VASRQTTMFQNEAQLLGINVDEVKVGWAEGKTLIQIAEAHGITSDQLKQKMKDAQMNQIKSQLATLVSKGVITQAQADSRLSVMHKFMEQGKGRLGKGFHRGF